MPRIELRYSVERVLTFATELLQQNGLPDERAHAVAEILLEADLMGHTTHGLSLLAPYLKELEIGKMTKGGNPMTIADRGAAVTWDGKYLPGPWLMQEAMNLAFDRIQQHPVVTVVIQRSHHIACLAAYLKQATDKGLFMLLTCSDPNVKSVVPHGGIQPMYTPNPIAAGIPTQGDPILLDISISTTANGVINQYKNRGERLPHQWLLDNQGNPTDDPTVFSTDPPGSLLPLGGTDLGYKGFALGLMIEAMTSALGGHGRSTPPGRWGASVFLQIIDPNAFGGRELFVSETQWLAESCRKSATKAGEPPVRLPGERALQLRAEQLQNGVALYPTIVPALTEWADKFGVPLPAPLS